MNRIAVTKSIEYEGQLVIETYGCYDIIRKRCCIKGSSHYLEDVFERDEFRVLAMDVFEWILIDYNVDIEKYRNIIGTEENGWNPIVDSIEDLVESIDFINLDDPMDG